MKWPQAFDQASPEAVAEVHRQGELLVQSQLQIALAADTRATTVAGITGAGAIASLVVAAQMEGQQPLALASSIMSVGLFFSSLLAAWASRATDFLPPGYAPASLAASSKNVTWMLRYASKELQRSFEYNRQQMAKAGKAFNISLLTAAATTVTSILVYLCALNRL